MARYAAIAEAFGGTGLDVRGGFAAEPGEALPAALDGAPARAVVLLGNAGPALWPAFSRERRDEPDPLDRWVERVVGPRAAALGMRPAYPSDRPWLPFQRWALRAEPVHPSPVGLLVHPEHGLWHAYRAALLLTSVPDGLPARGDAPSPCASCADRPCLAACPVGAHGPGGFDVDACAAHLARPADPLPCAAGCRSRDACPVGRGSRFPEAQVRFHQDAFARSRGLDPAAPAERAMEASRDLR